MFARTFQTISALRSFVRRHRRHLPAAALAAGLIWDSITLNRPDQLFENVVLLFYLFLAGVGIVLLNRHRELFSPDAPLWQLLLVQFSFGNLASGLFILYGQSGTLVGNWPFLLLLAALLVGNEKLRTRYGLARFNIAIYYLLVFAYLILVVPILLGKIGAASFIASGIASLAVITGFLFLVYLFAPRLIGDSKRQLTAIIGSIFLVFNILYFTNLIPPVPLALKDIGIYHLVSRTEAGNYTVSYESGEWFEFWRRSDKIFHRSPGARVYCFSSVFAPTGLDAPVYHRWEYFDEQSRNWRTATRISFLISGGRGEGFRGFSVKEAVFAGKWRCSVETERGVLIGRDTFLIVEASQEPDLITEIR